MSDTDSWSTCSSNNEYREIGDYGYYFILYKSRLRPVEYIKFSAKLKLYEIEGSPVFQLYDRYNIQKGYEDKIYIVTIVDIGMTGLLSVYQLGESISGGMHINDIYNMKKFKKKYKNFFCDMLKDNFDEIFDDMKKDINDINQKIKNDNDSNSNNLESS